MIPVQIDFIFHCDCVKHCLLFMYVIGFTFPMQDPKPPNFHCVSSDEVRITDQDAGVEVISAIPTLVPRNVRTNIAHGIFKEMAAYLDGHQQLKADEFAPEAECLLTSLSLTNFVADDWNDLVKELIESLKNSEAYQVPSFHQRKRLSKKLKSMLLLVKASDNVILRIMKISRLNMKRSWLRPVACNN
jgi:hypothetical protein